MVFASVGRGVRTFFFGDGKPLHPLWVLLAGLAPGFIIGVWLAATQPEVRTIVQYIMKVRQADLPRPVTPPPVGQAWTLVQTTGYCPCAICCGKADGITALMRDVRQYPFGIAADFSLIPQRTTVDVPGYGWAIVDDTGGAMRQSAKKGIVHMDLRFRSHPEARSWGVRRMWLALPADSAAAKMPEKDG